MRLHEHDRSILTAVPCSSTASWSMDYADPEIGTHGFLGNTRIVGHPS